MQEKIRENVREKLTIKSQLLTVIQTAICVIAVIAAVVIKAIGGDIYANVASWYFDTLGNSVFTDGKELFSPPKDNTQVKETSNLSPITNDQNSDPATVSGEKDK